MLPRFLLLAPLLASSVAFAQTPPLVQEQPPQDPRKNQKIERIHLEDTAVKIDELRVGGQTQSISVQPKSGMPAYEIVPPDAARQRANDTRDGSGGLGGQRVWNLFKF